MKQQNSTKITAEPNKQELFIEREFEAPVELVFRAHTEAELVEKWMGNKVEKLECKPHGGWRFESHDPLGNVVFSANGTIHEVVENEKFTRTFQMENTLFAVQLEFYEFEKLTDSRSKLKIHIVFKSVEYRDQLLHLPFAHGLNMAHDQLQSVLNKL